MRSIDPESSGFSDVQMHIVVRASHAPE